MNPTLSLGLALSQENGWLGTVKRATQLASVSNLSISSVSQLKQSGFPCSFDGPAQSATEPAA